MKSRAIYIAAAMAWCVLLAVGLRELHAYTVTPGRQDAAPVMWPAASALPHAGSTVVMFLHPECPCSRASLAELRSVVADVPPATLVFVTSSAMDIAGFSGARVIVDDGREAARFGAKTSGHVVAFDARGERVFAGGITAARGHRGDNVGRQSLVRALAGAVPLDTTHAVFGCAL